MEKVVVAISDIRHYDQLLALPARYEFAGKEWVIVHVNSDIPQFTVVNNQEVFAHDMLIQHRWNTLDQPVLNKRRKIWFLDRYDKTYQNVHLENVMKKHRAHHYQRLPVSSINFDTPKVQYTFNGDDGDYIIKPTGGARSMGIMFIDKPINLREFLSKMRTLLKNKDSVNADYIKLWDSFGIRYHIGKENRENEMAKVLADNSLVIQRMNPYKDVIEFRALSGTGSPLFFLRDHLHEDKNNVIDRIVGDVDPADIKLIDPDVYTEIVDVVGSGDIITYGSHDIWYSPEAKRWGIYEYQPQYGHDHIPAQQHIRFMKDVLLVAHTALNSKFD